MQHMQGAHTDRCGLADKTKSSIIMYTVGNLKYVLVTPSDWRVVGSILGNITCWKLL